MSSVGYSFCFINLGVRRRRIGETGASCYKFQSMRHRLYILIPKQILYYLYHILLRPDILSHNGSMFMGFLDASKAFDRLNTVGLPYLGN